MSLEETIFQVFSSFKKLLEELYHKKLEHNR